MKALRFALAALLVLGTSNFSQASEEFSVPAAVSLDDQTLEAINDMSEDSLADVLSPDELESEMIDAEGFTSFRLTAPVYTDRMYIRVNKANKGTSPTAQTMNVFLDGQLVYTWKVSTGRETPEVAKSGKIYRSVTPTGKYRFTRLSKDHVSATWQAPMPYAMFFIGGIAIHATTPSHYAALGSRDSGGCVRLHLSNAKTIWNLVQQVGPNNVLVEVVNEAY